MPVELRKRKAHQQPTAAPAAKKSSAGSKVSKVADKVKAAVAPKAAAASAPKKEDKKPAGGKPAPGDVVALDGFGGEIETNDGEKTTLKKLVDESKAGVVLFTYPKASTPGCTFDSH